MKGEGAKGIPAEGRGVGRPRVLVGETYFEASSGCLVRVLDSLLAKAGRAPSFIVESADGSRPGQRWLCREEELEGGRNGAATREVERWSAVFEATKEALLRAERAPRSKGGPPFAADAPTLASALRCMADELVRLARAGREEPGGSPP